MDVRKLKMRKRKRQELFFKIKVSTAVACKESKIFIRVGGLDSNQHILVAMLMLIGKFVIL